MISQSFALMLSVSFLSQIVLLLSLSIFFFLLCCSAFVANKRIYIRPSGTNVPGGLNSNLGLILPRFRDIAGFLLRRATLPPLFHPNFGVFLGLDCQCCIITFELIQHTRPRYINVTDGQLAIAIPRQHYVHRAAKIAVQRLEKCRWLGLRPECDGMYFRPYSGREGILHKHQQSEE